MWILIIDDKKAETFKQLIYQHTGLAFNERTHLKKNVSQRMKNSPAHRHFTKEKVEEYMTARPKKLLELHEEMVRTLGDASGVLSEANRKFVEHVFNYESYIKQNQEMSYALAHLMDVNTCTYCNRQYTLTVDDVDKNGETIEHLVRPEFDHWFSQVDYPDLALSYYNLIPACHTCNSNLKNRQEMDLEHYVHPYIDRRTGFRFSYVPISDGYAVDIEREKGVDDAYYRKVENTLKLFKLPQIYGAHSGLELKELLELASENHPDYITTLVKDVTAKLGVNETDAYRILFGVEVEEENYLKRPMSKFKSDVMRKIREDYK